jgi:hypothetical protein
MKEIYYLAYYDNLNSEKVRNVSPAAVNLVNYVLSKLSDAGYKTNIISFATTNKKGNYPHGKSQIEEFNATLKLFRFNYSPSTIIRKIRYLFFYIRAVIYLFINIKRNSTLIIYHSIYFNFIPKILKKIKKVKIVYQIMEIYGDVLNNSKIRRRELSNFKIGDSFILANSNISKYIASDKFTIIHGPYTARNNLEEREQKNIVNCVYSGTFDITKGVINAIEAFEYLDDNYQLHIMGFGSESEILAVKKAIEQSKNKNIYFHGLLLGNEYEKFLKKCDIGLSPQYSDALYNNTSFPSKIITYMSYGLQVVSSNIEIIRNSKVAKSIFFTLDDSPKTLAKVIVKAHKNKKDVISELKELDVNFSNELIKLI